MQASSWSLFPWMQSTRGLGTPTFAKRKPVESPSWPCAAKMRRAMRSCKRPPRGDSTIGGLRRRRRRGVALRYNVTTRQRRSSPKTTRRGWCLQGRCLREDRVDAVRMPRNGPTKLVPITGKIYLIQNRVRPSILSLFISKSSSHASPSPSLDSPRPSATSSPRWGSGCVEDP